MKKAATVVALLLASGVAYAERSEVDVLTEAAAHANAGRHAQAIALYEDVFQKTGDHELLPVLGVEYSWAGQPRKAVQNFCAYLTMAPRGQQAWFATSQVIMIRRELGDTVDARNVCAPTRVDFAPRPQRRSLSVRQRAAVATAAIGAASFGLSVYWNVQAKSISDEISAHPLNEPWPNNIGELAQRGERAQRLGNVALGVGGAALVTAGVLWFTGREKSETVIAPSVSASGAGVTLVRGF